MALEEVAPSLRRTVEFTCPMHPDVKSRVPGACPICGMALEPQTVCAEEEPNPELVDMQQRFMVSALLTAPIFVIAMAEHFPGRLLGSLLASPVAAWVQLILATPVVFWGGKPFLERAWQSIISRRLNMFTLIGLGTLAAYFYSCLALLAPAFRKIASSKVDFPVPFAPVMTLILPKFLTRTFFNVRKLLTEISLYIWNLCEWSSSL